MRLTVGASPDSDVTSAEGIVTSKRTNEGARLLQSQRPYQRDLREVVCLTPKVTSLASQLGRERTTEPELRHRGRGIRKI